MSLNTIAVMGRITKDIELRRTPNGKSVTNFTVAVDRDFEKGKADFIDVVCWGNTAEFAAKHFSKGRMAVVIGRLQMRDWKDKDGNNRKSAEIKAESMYFGDSKKQESGYATPDIPAFAELDDEDDLPF